MCVFVIVLLLQLTMLFKIGYNKKVKNYCNYECT